MLSSAITSNPRRLQVPYPNLLTLAVILVTTGLQLLLWPFIPHSPFILYYPALVICALFGNALLGLVLSAVLAKSIFFEPMFSWQFDSSTAVFMSTFIAVGLLIWQLGKTMRTALQHSIEAEAANRDLISRLEAARHLAESERIKLHSLFMQAPVVINILEGPDHRFVLCNPSARALVGGRDLTGLTVREAVPELGNQRFFEILDHVYASGEPFLSKEMPSNLRQPDGSVIDRFFDVVFQPYRDARGQVAGILNLSVDVTQDVLAKQRKERLVDELAEAVRARDEFMSIASHELRTPLTALKLQNQTRARNLEKGSTDAFSTEKLKKMLRSDGAQIDRLVRLVDDMLDLSRIRVGKLMIETESVDLSQLVSETIERHRPEFAQSECGIEVECKEPLNGNWDRFRLEQVVTNLLTNAMKYGAGRPVHVSTARENGRAVLRVKDHGRGIAKEDQNRIFERFERATPASEVSGLGLGLFISREILTLHRGTIRVESEPGLGSTFIVELPLS